MAQPRKSAARSSEPASAPEATDEDTRSTVVSIRDLLARSVMLTSDRIRETLDDAVERGRITRDDAEDLVERLVAVGRQQTDDALDRLESIAGAPVRAGERARTAVRRTPATDRVLREVDRVRRTAGLGSSFPISGYDDLTAGQVLDRLDDLEAADLRTVADYEKRNANRKTVLAAVEKKLR
jgi:polyhydroxyalkanoate synthesis regulator phasin